MKKMCIIRRALSLAIIMVVTLLLQGSDTVYGAEISDSEEWDMILDSEDVDEIVPESDELLVEETLDEPILAEETLDEQTIQDEEMELNTDSEVPHLTFDANGGYFDELSPYAVSWEGDEGAYTSQTFEYIDPENGTFVVPYMGDILNNASRDGYRFTDLWVEENDGDIFGVGGSYPFAEAKDRVYKARWVELMDESFQLDQEYGTNGVAFSFVGSDVYLSFKVKEEDYQSITIGEGEKLYFSYKVGAKEVIYGAPESPETDADGFYMSGMNLLSAEDLFENDGVINVHLFESVPKKSVDVCISDLTLFVMNEGVGGDYFDLSLVKESKDRFDKTKRYDFTSPGTITFDANGGYFPKHSQNAIAWEGEEGEYTSQTFNYIAVQNGGFAVAPMEILNSVQRDGYRDSANWFEENDGDVFGVSDELHPYPYIENKDRVYKATWIRNIDEIPQIDEEYGIDGISYIKDGNNIDLSFRIDKEKYESISVGADEKLLLLYSVGAKKRLRGLDEKATKDEDGYYNCLDWQEIDKNENCTIETQLFDSIPTESVDIRLGLGYVIIKSSDSEPVWSGSDFNVLAESSPRYFENYTYRKYTLPITSVSLKNEKVLSPVIGGNEVTSDITLNAGADISKLRLVYATNADEIVDKPDFLEYCFIEDGKLKVKASGNYQAGNEINIVFYDIENTHSPIQQKSDIAGNVRKIITAAPTWASKTLTASLTSASDVAFNLKVGAPSGESFVGGNYYIGVGVTDNAKTAKGLKSGLVISNVHLTYFKINDDGSFPEVIINPFRYDNPDTGDIVTELGEGCGTSMDVSAFLVMTDGAAPDKGGTVLATTDEKKVKALTISTKNPYYADKITLKKGVTSLYAGDTDKIVATVDFGKNTTYTRAEDWEIENAGSLAMAGIIAEQEGNNKIKVRVADYTKAGTYTITVATKADAVDGVPARASISVKVLPTATTIESKDFAIYHTPGKVANATMNVTVLDQDGAVIKKPALSYEIGNYDDGNITPVSGLSVSKGKIKVDKKFTPEEEANYAVKVTAKCGKEISAPVFIEIAEKPIELAYFAFPTTEPATKIEATEMTLHDYLNMGWDMDLLPYLPATLDMNDVYDGLMCVLDKEEDTVDGYLIKSIKITNPLYIKKTGKVTLTATAIDGTKLTKNITIIPDTEDFGNDVYISGQYKIPEYEPATVAPNGSVDASGESTNATYTVWLQKNDTVNTKNGYISGEKLTVKGGKIVENNHDDYIKFVMTGKTATITRKKGKTVVGKYTITNNSFDLKTIKVSAEKGQKVYANFGGGEQRIIYKFNKAIEGVYTTGIKSTNSVLNEYLKDGDIYTELDGNDGITIIFDELTGPKLKAGSYPFTIELFDEDDNALCKPSKATLKIEKFKKSFKFTTKYTMSNKDKTHFKLEASGVNYDHIPEVGEIKLFNANTKGKYNNVTDILEVYWDSEDDTSIKLRDGKELPSAKSITGYIGYTVNFKDGSSEYRLDKITINISNQALKYKADTKNITLANKGEAITGITVLGNNKEIAVAHAKVLDTKSLGVINEVSAADGKLSVKLNPDKITKAGTYSIKVNVIPKGSVYEGEEVTAANSILITVKIKVTK